MKKPDLDEILTALKTEETPVSERGWNDLRPSLIALAPEESRRSRSQVRRFALPSFLGVTGAAFVVFALLRQPPVSLPETEKARLSLAPQTVVHRSASTPKPTVHFPAGPLNSGEAGVIRLAATDPRPKLKLPVRRRAASRHNPFTRWKASCPPQKQPSPKVETSFKPETLLAKSSSPARSPLSSLPLTLVDAPMPRSNAEKPEYIIAAILPSEMASSEADRFPRRYIMDRIVTDSPSAPSPAYSSSSAGEIQTADRTSDLKEPQPW